MKATPSNYLEKSELTTQFNMHEHADAQNPRMLNH